MHKLAEKIRGIPDFPRAGILFRDITTLLKDGQSFAAAIDAMNSMCQDIDCDLIVAPEARGFIMGAPMAYALKKGFVPVRKAGKLPSRTRSVTYTLEYGHDKVEIHEDSIEVGQKVLVVDDLLATGGTIRSAIELVESLGGIVVGVAFLIELTELRGREALAEYDVRSLIEL
ncbi:MAG: adenine phosphoribosyltransferase [bacterium]|nr:adenine phosphoribosyltransferase [bacterium]